MAYAYPKTADDMTLIWGAREHGPRQFDFGVDWTEIRIGMFSSMVTLAGDNTTPVSDETIPVVTAYDRYFFGIKDSSALVPGVAGSVFLGMSNRTGTPVAQFKAAAQTIGDSDANGGLGGLDGVTSVGFGSSFNSSISGATNPSGLTAYSGFTGLRFVITNRGLATQSIDIYSARETSVAGADYSAAALRTKLGSTSWSGPQTIAWNDGVAARTIPDCWFLRNPFYNTRIRVSAHDVLLIAPV